MIEQTKFTYSPPGSAFKKQTKTIEDSQRKQAEALQSLNPKQQNQKKDLFSKNLLNTEAKVEMDKIKMIE